MGVGVGQSSEVSLELLEMIQDSGGVLLGAPSNCCEKAIMPFTNFFLKNETSLSRLSLSRARSSSSSNGSASCFFYFFSFLLPPAQLLHSCLLLRRQSSSSSPPLPPLLLCLGGRCGSSRLGFFFAFLLLLRGKFVVRVLVFFL